MVLFGVVLFFFFFYSQPKSIVQFFQSTLINPTFQLKLTMAKQTQMDKANLKQTVENQLDISIMVFLFSMLEEVVSVNIRVDYP